MKLPSEVYVIGHRYSIEEMDEHSATDSNIYGHCSNHSRKIKVYCNGGGSIARDTLLHEVLHAVWNLMGLEKEDEEERIVNSTSTAIIGIIDDPRNKDVVDFIFNKHD